MSSGQDSSRYFGEGMQLLARCRECGQSKPWPEAFKMSHPKKWGKRVNKRLCAKCVKLRAEERHDS